MIFFVRKRARFLVLDDPGKSFMLILSDLFNSNKYNKRDALFQVAGGISGEEGVLKTVIRECKEEAGIPEKLASSARPAGTVR